MSTESTPAEDALLLRTLALVALAAATCVIYDHITTLDAEIELVWKRKWSLVQFLFFVNRYLGDAVQIYSAVIFVRHVLTSTAQLYVYSCPGSQYFLSIGYLILIVYTAMEGIMVYRVSSMYNRDRKVTAILIMVFAAHIVSGLVVQLLAWVNGLPVSDPGVVVCAGKILPKWVSLVWIAPILFELTILGFSLNKGIEYYRALGPVTSLRLHASRRSLVYILFRDSITFPFIGLLAAALNLLTWLSYSRYVPLLTFMVLSFVPCILGCRLVLNLREAYYKPFLEEAGAGDTHSFDLGFNVAPQDDNHIGMEDRSTNSGGLFQRYAPTQLNRRSVESIRTPRGHHLEPP